jgi:hypothetical protein
MRDEAKFKADQAAREAEKIATKQKEEQKAA